MLINDQTMKLTKNYYNNNNKKTKNLGKILIKKIQY